MTTTHCFRVVSYNTHKSIGVDRKISPARIVEVLREIDADIIGLQEVLSIPDASAEEDQARYFASQLGYHYCLGETRKLRGGIYGNVILTRVPVHSS
ncbi:MAG TPA: endonuclease/exonuclease/phosphatase family protein, partial [Acidobacteriota bacterium]|nr:endonuclease/exonuclease/phosphatase family protein [Acidobacteriota bacterium]